MLSSGHGMAIVLMNIQHVLLTMGDLSVKTPSWVGVGALQCIASS